jgi:hypothetical protein
MKRFLGALAAVATLATVGVLLPSAASAQVLLLQQPVIQTHLVSFVPAAVAVPVVAHTVEVHERTVWVPQRVREQVVVDHPVMVQMPVMAAVPVATMAEAAVPVAVAHGTWTTWSGATVRSTTQQPAHWIWTLP